MLSLRDQIFMELNKDRHALELCDFAVTIGNNSFSIHRNIMATASPYIKRQLKLNEYHVKLEGCTDLGFRHFLDYVYLEKRTYSVDDVIEALQTASLLECKQFQEDCAKFMEDNVTLETCFSYLEACSSVPDLQSTKENILKYICSRMPTASSTPHFKHISKENLLSLLQILQEETKLHQKDIALICIQWCEQNLKTDSLEIFRTLNVEVLCEHDINSLLNQGFLEREDQQPLQMRFLQAIRQRACNGQRCQIDHAEKYIRARGEIIAISKEAVCKVYNFNENQVLDQEMRIAEFVDICESSQAIATGNKLYIIGGHDSDALFCFDFNTEQWVTLPRLRNKGCRRAVTSHDSNIFLIGGAPEHSNVDKFSTTEAQLSTLSNSPLVAQGSSACAANGLIYLSGGRNGDCVFDHIHIFDIENNSWTFMRKMLIARSGHFSCFVNGGVYFVGNDSHETPAIEMLQPTTRQCTIILQNDDLIMSCIWHQQAVLTSDGIIYFNTEDNSLAELNLETVNVETRCNSGYTKYKKLMNICAI